MRRIFGHASKTSVTLQLGTATATRSATRRLLRLRSIPRGRRSACCVSSDAAVDGFAYDVVALGNLCVDVVVHVPQLPSTDTEVRKALLKQLTQKQVLNDDLEVGGNCNFIVAAARLGLRVAAVGHTGSDQFGNFLVDVLQVEGSGCAVHQMVTELTTSDRDATLVCFVLVDPASQHAFCSSYDFGPWPLLPSITGLLQGSAQVLSRSRAVFANGFIFDELPVSLIQATVKAAADSGVAVFFDPGPRCFTMMEQGDRRQALCSMLDMSDVVLMTLEEAATVTGELDPEAAAKWVLQRPGAHTKWCVVKLGGTGSLAVARGADGSLETVFAPAFEVNVVDTVGCGDSFAAAVVLGYLQGQDLVSTLQLANAVGAATAMGRGAGRNVAGADAVLTLLETQLQGEELLSSSIPINMLRMSLSDC